MKIERPIEELLRWRLARAESEAPPAPRAARLLAEVRPWWDTWPEQFRSLVERLGYIQIGYGHAMSDAGRARTGHPVAALVLHAGREVETSVRVLYLNTRDRQLRFRFQLDTPLQPETDSFEATFISEGNKSPVLSAQATRSVDSEYRIDAEVSAELAENWGQLRVTDRMPFRLILRSGSITDGG